MANHSAERVKIIATIGPASADPKVLRSLLEEGVDAIRINASHAPPETIADWVGRVRRASRAAKREVPVMLDLQGIKHRIGTLDEPMMLEEGSRVVLSPRRGAGKIPVKLGEFGKHIRPGLDIFLHDGFLRLRVERVRDGELECTVMLGGPLKSRVGFNIPGIPVKSPIPTRRDLKHLEAGVAAGVDIFAVSFVRDAKDVLRTRARTAGIPIIAKIERPEAVQNIDEIARVSDGLLIARGDLAVEMQPEQLPVLQKTLVAAGNRARKPVIIATEMLGSMVHKPRPTRAELTDVGNAVLDGADATLLSDETAIGDDPVRAVRFMSRILHTVERALGAYDVSLPLPQGGKASRPDWAIADAAVDVAVKVQACAIIAMTGSGRTARLISASRPSVPLFTYTPDVAVRRRIAILWGVNARGVKPNPDQDRLIRKVLRDLRKEEHITSGERVVVVFGSPVWAEGTKTNTVRVEVVP